MDKAGKMTVFDAMLATAIMTHIDTVEGEACPYRNPDCPKCYPKIEAPNPTKGE